MKVHPVEFYPSISFDILFVIFPTIVFVPNRNLIKNILNLKKFTKLILKSTYTKIVINNSKTGPRLSKDRIGGKDSLLIFPILLFNERYNDA